MSFNWSGRIQCSVPDFTLVSVYSVHRLTCVVVITLAGMKCAIENGPQNTIGGCESVNFVPGLRLKYWFSSTGRFDTKICARCV